MPNVFLRRTAAALLFCGVAVGTTWAQKVPGGCATPGHLHHHLTDPALAAQRQQAVAQIQEQIQLLQRQLETKGYKTGQVITVPVVFHVLYNNSTEDIPDVNMESQIVVLNEDFRRQNNDASQTLSQFQGVAADVEIEFCLAKIDPNGDPTTGITRTQTPIRSFNVSSTEIYSTADGGHDAWDTDRYLNIWICDLGTDLYGFATPPGTAGPSDDGVVLNYRNVGRVGASGATNLGRTGTHEVGHYFDLEHIWGDSPGCSPDDGVSDTPAQDQEYYGCPNDDPESCGNGGDMYQNYMDYVDDACMNLFTQGQKVRMLAALNGPRSGLIGNAANVCDLPSGLNPATLPLQLTLGPNPTAGPLTLGLTSAPLQPLELQVINALGQVMTTQTLPAAAAHTVELSAAGWPAGVYLLTLSADSQSIASRRLVVQ